MKDNFKNLKVLLGSSTKEIPYTPAREELREKRAENMPKRMKEHSNFLKGINRSPAQQEIDGNEKKRKDNG